ncbi:tRNA epoxyqueuosine(34) reductase QueG [Rhodospirillaceae bacterium]|nr:tRNA epoxyqueuosine(34) reductase QueG [Rhodospirillaceae bacterium]MBT6306126.1 tRNA epoxyqueuosine(34) reductase QueG [Rhodospirillaceae bacterium]MBT7730635.1 tRNA epoxyqueuosine(34) reductase QueG [Rhodospirillaceae bacterium]MDC0997834.1 tRNA epoxyqueuosine(34) reductase QueG [Alphaproteobacteria bacterium]MDC1441828.1 tRNA epoxyqueuosine(34) reductase QueG [Rhodospirillaceae bacterium]
MKERIRAKAKEEGFDAVGFAQAEMGLREKARLEAFVSLGHHGDMTWMAEHLERRKDPRSLWPGARSVIAVAINYGPENSPLNDLRAFDRANISVYARNKDYHNLIKKRLKKLGRWLGKEFNCDLKVFVDTAPILEKPLGQAAGIGWQGKHSNLVNQKFGSWLFLGEIFTTLNLEPDASEVDHCGSCKKCLDICPTNAFPEPYMLDASRCISYLTIEHKGHIPVEYREKMGNRIYGCDDCLAVCPWNKFAKMASESAFIPREDLSLPLLEDLLCLDDLSFREKFSGSPIKRIGRDRFIRNVLIAMGNSRAKTPTVDFLNLLGDSSNIVRAMAVWALGRMISGKKLKTLSAPYLKVEPDADVLEEWDRALAAGSNA